MKVKEALSPDFKNEDILKENKKYLAVERSFGEESPTKYQLKNKETNDVLFQLEVPSPFEAKKDFEKDFCLKYGHGGRGFLLSLFDYVSENKEINPPYSPDNESDIFFQMKGEKVYAFIVEEPDSQVGYFSRKEYMELFIDYFGFRTAFVLT